jgi:hypothetical protein
VGSRYLPPAVFRIEASALRQRADGDAATGGRASTRSLIIRLFLFLGAQDDAPRYSLDAISPEPREAGDLHELRDVDNDLAATGSVGPGPAVTAIATGAGEVEPAERVPAIAVQAVVAFVPEQRVVAARAGRGVDRKVVADDCSVVLRTADDEATPPEALLVGFGSAAPARGEPLDLPTRNRRSGNQHRDRPTRARMTLTTVSTRASRPPWGLNPSGDRPVACCSGLGQ